MSSDGGGYVVISPVRDEVENLGRTAQSLIEQARPPLEWIIVDDGSTDGTAELAATFAAERPWIRLLQRPARAERARGAPVVRAFNFGLSHIAGRPEFVVKLDGDMHLPPHYFAWVSEVFRRRPDAGIVGGIVYIDNGERWVPDRVHPDTVHGALKAYRLSCLESIGGLHESMGWDGIDEYAARARGWRVVVLSELQALHYKARGSKQPWRKARWEEGRGGYYMGYLPSFMAVRVVYRMLVEHPPILGGVVMGAAYVWSALTRSEQVPDAEARAELRRTQRSRLRAMVRVKRERSERSFLGPAYDLTDRLPSPDGDRGR